MYDRIYVDFFFSFETIYPSETWARKAELLRNQNVDSTSYILIGVNQLPLLQKIMRVLFDFYKLAVMSAGSISPCSLNVSLLSV